jgi:glycosyltransferase involved in cell wall biosynthesis
MYNNKRVAILAPGSVRGEIGGAERFYGGLHGALLETGCDAELLSIPTDESNFDSILHMYEHCRKMDLSGYDLVISTKAPTFAASHPNHVLYLVHTIRVFYDMFEQTFPWADEALRSQRQTIHMIDSETIGRIANRFSIGHEVSERLRLWNHLEAEVLHPPLATQQFRHGKIGNYFFLPGRLHTWKRVDLVIRAVQCSKLPLQLIIAGIGAAERELKALANGDPRITFLGRIDDDQLIDLYANSLAVPFVPQREDYGYITLEAFASAKPVITCRDSGEPRQFVVDGKNGLVCDATPESLCAAMERLFNDRASARLMGLQGALCIQHMTWPRVADRLLQAAFGRSRLVVSDLAPTGISTKVAVVDMQPIEPAIGGGRLRLLGVYHALGSEFETRYVGTYDWPGEKYRHHRLSPSLEEIDVPLSEAHHEAARILSSKAGGKTIIDQAFPQQCHLSPDYLAKVRETIAWADVVVFSHPWVFPLVRDDLRPDQVVIYDAHNVEGLLRAQILDVSNKVERELLQCVVQAEYDVGRGADLIIACSQDDVELFERLYKWVPERMLVVPNGVMASATTPATTFEQAQIRARLGIGSDRPVVLFLGSAYPPNVDAAKFVINSLAPTAPGVLFVIGGGVGNVLSVSAPNVTITGQFDDATRIDWLRASDLAINPMFSGSGTNIKMFDFMGAGLPILSTKIGARGIAKLSGGGVRLASRDEFAHALADLLARPGQLRALGIQNRRWAEEEFAWERISPRVGEVIKQLIKKSRSSPRVGERPRLAHLSTVGQVCGIGEYTARLLESLNAQEVPNYVITCATPASRPLRSSLPANTDVGWYYDDESWRDSHIDPDVVARLKSWGAEYVLVQYHSAFLSGAALVAFVESCLSCRIYVAVEVHNYSLADKATLRRLGGLGCVLIGHSRQEIAEADANGLTVRYLPLLVPRVDGLTQKSLQNRDFRINPPLIASTGFIRPHKGLPQLIEALPLVRRRYPGARLLLQCSLYPSADSQAEYELCLKRIRSLHLNTVVELDTVFRPIDEVHRRLAIADLAVLPYGASNEGGSASATTVLASGVPLVISRSQVFSDVGHAADRMADTAPHTIADTICRLFTQTARYDDLASRAIAYGEGHSGAIVARQLLEILRFPQAEIALPTIGQMET